MITVDFYSTLDMTQLTIWRGYPTNYSDYQISIIDPPYSGTYTGYFTYNLYGVITGGAGSNTFIAGAGDTITGGAAIDTFVVSAGSSGDTAAKSVTINQFHTGMVGTMTGRDVIEDSSATLQIGGSNTASPGSLAVINQTTGMASLSTALHDIASAFHASGDQNGDFAFFKLSSGGNLYLYISAGNETAPSMQDNLIQLVGVKSVAEAVISGGHLNIVG